MRYSHYFPKTLKEAPKDEVAVNAKYLLRAGFIDKLMAGSYTLLPLGRRVERKIEQIIREEMDKTGALEVLMPLLHPKEIWNETGRWETAKDVMYQFEKDERSYALSFTHEEITMDLIRKHVSSYKDLPVKLYHFSTKFRNELRAKSGILRGREFLMKDLYSAHISKEDLMEYYWQVADAYVKAFRRMGFDVVVTEAAGGVFTDSYTHEFQVVTDVGEDTIYFSKDWKFAKNEEIMTEEDRKKPDLYSRKSIEVGNIFPLGLMYAEKMGAYVTDAQGVKKPLWFGSYGIGPTRVMGTVVEILHDDKGMIWPVSIAPYHVHLVSVSSDSPEVKNAAEKVYTQLQDAGVEVLYDDRDVGNGQKLADADLIGIPYRIVVSNRTIQQGAELVELKMRSEEKTEMVEVKTVVKKVHEAFASFAKMGEKGINEKV